MENDDKTVGRLFTRREVISIAIASRAGLALGATGGILRLLGRDAEASTGEPETIHLVASPSLTEGPFYVNEKLQRSNLVDGNTRRTILDAVPLRLNLKVYGSADNVQFAPLPGATVDIWHVDATGVYSDEPQGLNPENTEGQHWLRGYQTTDAHGKVQFDTIFPGWYRGRTTHVHFKVRYLLDGKIPATFTSQLFVPDALADSIYQKSPYQRRWDDEMHNDDDNVYRDTRADSTIAGPLMTLAPKRAAAGKGYVADFNIGLWTHPHPSNGGRRISGD